MNSNHNLTSLHIVINSIITILINNSTLLEVKGTATQLRTERELNYVVVQIGSALRLVSNHIDFRCEQA